MNALAQQVLGQFAVEVQAPWDAVGAASRRRCRGGPCWAALADTARGLSAVLRDWAPLGVRLADVIDPVPLWKVLAGTRGLARIARQVGRDDAAEQLEELSGLLEG